MGITARTFAALALASALTGGLTACGGDDSSSTGAKATETSASKGSSSDKSTETTEKGSTETTKADVSGIGKDKDFCAGLAKAEKDLNNDNFEPSKLKDLLPIMKDLSGKAPSELKADMKLMTDAFTKAAPVIDKLTELQDQAAKDPSKAQAALEEITKLGKEVEVFSSKEFEDASARLSAYAEEKCGLKTD